MKRTTIFADQALLDELKALSAERGVSVAQLVREALTEHVARRRRPRRTLSFIGIGRSGRREIAAQHERLLWRKPPR
ncbi:MAG: CopG family transcriptional regulator [Burkholderiales bacterium]